MGMTLTETFVISNVVYQCLQCMAKRTLTVEDFMPPGSPHPNKKNQIVMAQVVANVPNRFIDLGLGRRSR